MRYRMKYTAYNQIDKLTVEYILLVANVKDITLISLRDINEFLALLPAEKG